MMPDEKPAAPRPIEFFSAANLDDIDTAELGPQADDLKMNFRDENDREAIMAGNALFAPHMKSFATTFDDTGLHIGVVEFAPGIMTPLHSHADHCAYYVERGSVVMGNRTLGPGEGFLVRKDQPYGFAAGPEGLRLIEFTSGPRTNIDFVERNPVAWKQRLEKAVAKLGGDTASDG